MLGEVPGLEGHPQREELSEASIDTPIRCKPYPLPYAMREELQN